MQPVSQRNVSEQGLLHRGESYCKRYIERRPGTRIRLSRADVPRASARQLPFVLPRWLLGRTDSSPRPDLHRQEHCTFSRRAE